MPIGSPGLLRLIEVEDDYVVIVVLVMVVMEVSPFTDVALFSGRTLEGSRQSWISLQLEKYCAARCSRRSYFDVLDSSCVSLDTTAENKIVTHQPVSCFSISDA